MLLHRSIVGQVGGSHMKRECIAPPSDSTTAAVALRTLVESSSDHIVVKDVHLRTVICNTLFSHSVGKEPEELCGKTNVENGWDPEYVKGNEAKGIQGWENDDLGVLQGKTLQSAREPANVDGRVHYFNTLKVPLRLESGNVVGLLGISRDITASVLSDQKLREQGAIVEASDDAIISKTLDGTIVSWNHGAELIYGYTAQEVIGKSISILIPLDAHNELPGILERIGKGERVEHYETVRVRKDGTRIEVSLTVSPVLNDAGLIVGASAIARDISESRRAGRRIESLAQFPDESPHPVMRVTPEGALIYANAASKALALFRRERGIETLEQSYLKGIRDSWESRTRQEIEIRIDSATFILTVVPLLDAGYVNIYGRDITAERSLAERLKQVEKMEAIGQLTGGIAHDFNNVLQAVLGYSEMIERTVSEKDRKYVDEISKAANRAGALTAQLLAFSRKQVLKPRTVNPVDLIRSLLKLLDRVLGEHIEIETSFTPGTGNFLADPGQIEQVLINLAVNARDAMATGGKLLIETKSQVFDDEYVRDHPGSRPGRFVCIAVSDTGVGMDETTRARMYEPFFTTKPVGEGTGLGLSTVYGIVNQSGGYLNCYSELGKGTTFTVYLPETEHEPAQPVVERSPASGPRGLETILLVDDDASVRAIERIVLAQAGYSVVEASQGPEALSEVSARGIEVALLITDVVMPRMSGKELAARLRELSPKAKVLFASGYTSNIMSHHGILDTDVDYLQKPFLSLDLLTKVREVLDRQE